MRKYLFLCLLTICTAQLYAQFGPAIYIDTTNTEVIDHIVCADFSHDGDTDLLVLNNAWPCDYVTLHLNNANRSFSTTTVAVADSFMTLEHIAAADVDNDSWTDFAIVHGMPAKIYWYENNNGSFVSHLIDDSLDYTTQLIFCDLDRNGTQDLISLQHTKIVVYYASTPGNFGPPQVVHASGELYAMQTGYFNNDQFPDIAVASLGFEILLNNGVDSFTLKSQQGLGLTFGLEAGDLDMDGDNDIVAYESLVGLLFYANDGNGDFTVQDTVLESFESLRIYTVRDLNSDHAPDIYTSLQQQGKMIVMRNNGNGTFAVPDTIHTEPGNLVESTATCDLNGDGKPDLIWGNRAFAYHLNLYVASGLNEIEENKISFYPNPASELLNVQNRNTETMQVQVMDCYGRVHSHYKVAAGQTILLPLADKGVYFLDCSFSGGAKRVVKKVVNR